MADDGEWVMCKCGRKFEGENCWPDLWEHVARMAAEDDPLHFATHRSAQTWDPKNKQGVQDAG